MRRACHIHDQVNLIVLPILGSLTIAGVLGYVDPVNVSMLFTAYIIADFTWILLEPHAVPSLPTVILVHHVVTMILLCFPLRYPKFAKWTCWDGLCEINTFFLIARRQFKSLRQPMSILYWATFFPSRIFLYPYLLFIYYHEVQPPHALWELILVCSCQLLLIAFNFALLGLSIMNWQKRGLVKPTVIQSSSDGKVAIQTNSMVNDEGKKKGGGGGGGVGGGKTVGLVVNAQGS